MGKQRILILTTSYPPLIGGSELAIYEITKRLPDLLFDIVTGRLDKRSLSRERVGNVTIYRVGALIGHINFIVPKILLPVALFAKAFRLMFSNRYIAIHAWQASQAAGAGTLLSLLFHNTPFLVTLQEGKDLDRQSWFVRFFRRFILRRADCVIAISSFLGSYARRLAPRVRADIIPNGVDVQIFDTQLAPNERARIREQWGILSEERVIINVSRLVEKNGLADLIKAISLVKNKAKLVIAGSGPLKNDLEALVQELGIEQKVKFLGYIPYEQLPRMLKCADVFVRPSLSEGLGTAFLEAMTAGLPVIGTSVGGITDFITNGETGILCVPGDVQGIADAIDKALGDSSFIERITRNGLELIHKLYSWERVAGMYHGVYHRFLS